MNVTSVGTTPTPLPAPLPVSKPVAADRAHDARHEAAPQQAAQQAKKPEKERVELPPLKPVSTQEFRVMLGALPISVLSGSRAKTGSFDVYA